MKVLGIILGVLLLVGTAYGQAELLDKTEGGSVVVADKGTAHEPFNTRIWDANMKNLFDQVLDAMLARNRRLDGLAELALQNSVAVSQMVNTNVLHDTHSTNALARTGATGIGAGGIMSQGRQFASSDTALGVTQTGAAVAGAQLELAASKLADLVSVPLLRVVSKVEDLEARMASLVALLEAQRNPPVGSGTTGQGVPVGPGR